MSLMSQSVAQREERSTFSGLRGAGRKSGGAPEGAMRQRCGGLQSALTHLMSL